MSGSHPEIRTVTLMGGRKVAVRPWTMAQRAELRPRVLAVLEQLQALGDEKDLTMAGVFAAAEDEIVDIVRRSIPKDELSEEAWDGIYWTADIPTLATELWTVNFPPESLLGKAIASLAGKWLLLLAGGATSPKRSPNPSGNGASRPASPSSPGADTETPSASGTP